MFVKETKGKSKEEIDQLFNWFSENNIWKIFLLWNILKYKIFYKTKGYINNDVYEMNASWQLL